MIEQVGSVKILRTSFNAPAGLFASVQDKLIEITKQPNQFPGFIYNGSCSFHNFDDHGRLLYQWPEFVELIAFLKANIQEYLKSIDVDETNISVSGMWANRYPPGAFVGKHNHNYIRETNTLVIGVLYYLRKDKDAGSLVIDIPDYGEYNVDMNEGDVVIFPSSLDHWTVPNNSNTDKYVLGLELALGENGISLEQI